MQEWIYKNIEMIKFTTGSVDDRKVLDEFLELLGNSLVIGDAGYVSKELEGKARENNNVLITVSRKNMGKMTTRAHHYLLNLRPRIESIFSVLKQRFGLVSSLPRSELGYFAHYIHCIFGYLTSKSFASR